MHWGRFLLGAAVILPFMVRVADADQIRVFGAGSLRKVVTEIGAAYTAQSGTQIKGEFGPSGYMAGRVTKGEHIDLFASADMNYPTKLQKAGLTGPVVLFTRSDLCVLANRNLDITSDNVLDRLVDPKVLLGTTAAPGVGPLGEYTAVLLGRVDKVRPGTGSAIRAKLIQLPDARDENVVNGQRPEVAVFASGKVNAVIAYCATAKELEPQIPGAETIEMPASVRVGADYGMAVAKGAKPASAEFALFILSGTGQEILQKEGYQPVTLPDTAP